MAGRSGIVDVKVNSNLTKIADALPSLFGAVIERQTMMLWRQAARLAPVGESGLLHNSGTYSVLASTSPVVGEVTFHAYYAAYVNFGTGSRGAASKVPDRPDNIRYTQGWVGMAAQPYLSIAYREVVDELRVWAKELGEMIASRFAVSEWY